MSLFSWPVSPWEVGPSSADGSAWPFCSTPSPGPVLPSRLSVSALPSLEPWEADYRYKTLDHRKDTGGNQSLEFKSKSTLLRCFLTRTTKAMSDIAVDMGHIAVAKIMHYYIIHWVLLFLNYCHSTINVTLQLRIPFTQEPLDGWTVLLPTCKYVNMDENYLSKTPFLQNNKVSQPWVFQLILHPALLTV